MKFLYVLVVICLAAAGYFAYEEGKLASLHPLLDPASRESTEGEVADVTPDSEPEESEVLKPEKAAPPKSDEKKSAAKEEAEKKAELARIKEEEKAAAAEAREQEKQAAAEAKAKALAEYEQKRAAIDSQMKALVAKRDELNASITQAHQNRSKQELAWRQERIKTPEVEKEKLRQASQNYIDQMEAEVDVLFDQIRAKGAELRAIPYP